MTEAVAWARSEAGRREVAALLVVLLAGALTGAWGCGHDAPVVPPPPPRDTTRPVVRIVYPPPDSVGRYDRDSNGLADLELAWSDSAGRVNPITARITCAPDCLPGVPADTNLAAGWRMVRSDSGGLVLEETVPLLLREGSPTLTITVADTAGNLSLPATVALTLPPGAYHRSIDLAGRPDCQPERGVNLALSSDGTKGFAPFHFCVAVFDPDGVAPTHFIDNVPNNGWAAHISVDAATGLAYIAGGGTPTTGFTVLDTRTEQVVANHVTPTDVAGVAVDGERIYAGEDCTDGSIWVFDKATLAPLGRIPVGAVTSGGGCTNAVSYAFSSDHLTGWAGITGAGVVRFDISTLTLTGYFDLEPDWPDYLGDSRAIALVNDHRLYLARVREGFDLYETNPWHQLAYDHSPVVFVGLTVSPDRSAIAASVTGSVAFGGTLASAPRLYAVGSGLTQQYAFAPRFGHVADAVVFHPDGKRFYVMAEFQVDVYLVRPR